jgi:hypothetical protein
MTDAMIRFRKKGIDAVYVYPYANSDKRVTVYELRAEDIDSVVSKEVVYGNYRLGVLDSQKRFWVFYVGRSDNNLNKRLHDHIDEEQFKHIWTEQSVYFDFNPAVDEKDAFQRECIDYHSFKSDFLMNKKHPDCPNGTCYQCPCCG